MTGSPDHVRQQRRQAFERQHCWKRSSRDELELAVATSRARLYHGEALVGLGEVPRPMNGIRLGSRRTDVIRTAGFVAVVFGLALASCSSVSSNTPRFDWLAPSTDATLTIDSSPRGALASTSNGGTCQTPCELSVPVIEAFTVTFTLDGYLPQTFSVRPVAVEKSALIDQTPPRLEPNPVLAELKPAPPPPPPEPPLVNKRRRP